MQAREMATSYWRRFWLRAPRQLRFTHEGKVIVGLALAVGFAAVNTGNNLLFLAWGLVLSAIVVSGVLSEAALRVLSVRLARLPTARAGETVRVPLMLRNTSRRVPSFALDLRLRMTAATWSEQGRAPLLLRLDANDERATACLLTPLRRGRHVLEHASVRTRYPFGFFIKSRRLELRSELWVWPARIDVAALVPQVAARIGQSALARPGRGEEYFAMRAYRSGDDLRRVAWRKSARTQRWVVIEHEVMAAREVLLELVAAPLSPVLAEHAVALLGSLAEELLAYGYRVGGRTAGVLLTPEAGSRQRARILDALARMQLTAPLPPWRASMAVARVAIGASEGADVVLPITHPDR